MKYHRVCIESFGYALPEQRVTTAELESRLTPLYRRLRLPEGRLELITGIEERRFWPHGASIGEQSARAGRLALAAAEFDPARVGALIHGSVCRDHLEPATACKVHHQLGLPPGCVLYDVSNACLGLLSGIVQVANMIELRQIQAGLVVGCESSRQVVEHTIETLNADTTLTRRSVKDSIATLTLGSAACGVFVCDAEVSRTGNRLLGATALANTRFHDLCQSGQDTAGADMRPLMSTNSEKLMEEGIATGAKTFELFLQEHEISREQIDHTFAHQVGPTHHNRMYEALGLDPARDFTTMRWLGNTGAVAAPVTAAIGADQGLIPDDPGGKRVALLGIGSGINCLMLLVDWRKSIVMHQGRLRRRR